jgi:hypothetical protein
MIVLLAGMPRSGSTFAFNVVREVLELRGTVYHETGQDAIGAVGRAGGAEHVLVKEHGFDDASVALALAGRARVIMTVRRVEDAMASWLETFEALPEELSLQKMRIWLKLFARLRSVALIVPYEEIDCRPAVASWRIARAVWPEIGPAEATDIGRRYRKAAVKQLADRLMPGAPGVTDLGFSYFDNTTFFHRRHVTTLTSRAAEARMEPERLARIGAALADDIRVSGFVLPH